MSNTFKRPVSGDVIPYSIVRYLEWVSGVDKRKLVIHTSLPTLGRINLSSAESADFEAGYEAWANPYPANTLSPLQESIARAEQATAQVPVRYVAISYGLECMGIGSSKEEAIECALESAWKSSVTLHNFTEDASNQVLVSCSRYSSIGEGTKTLSSVRMTLVEV